MMRITSALVFVCASFLVGCAWGEGSPGDDTGGGVDAAVASGATCGDSVCAASEVNSCMQDCGSGGGSGVNPICGNSTCETGETSASCPNDCGGGGSGSGSGTCPTDPLECLLCSFDAQFCMGGQTQASCAACGGGLPTGGGLPGGGGGTCNNDGTCDAAEVTDPTCADCI